MSFFVGIILGFAIGYAVAFFRLGYSWAMKSLAKEKE